MYLKLESSPYQDIRGYSGKSIVEVYSLEVVVNSEKVFSFSPSHPSCRFLASLSNFLLCLDIPRFRTEKDFVRWIHKQDNIVIGNGCVHWGGYLIEYRYVNRYEEEGD